MMATSTLYLPHCAFPLVRCFTIPTRLKSTAAKDATFPMPLQWQCPADPLERFWQLP